MKYIFAPLAIEGPLPSAITPRLVKSVFANSDTNMAYIFKKLRISKPTRPEGTLRNILDAPQKRRALARLLGKKGQSLAFHELLYHYCKRNNPIVFKEFISPCLDHQGELVFLDSEKFTQKLHTADLNSALITDESSAEYILALFALSFGLLQEEDAEKIILPLVSIGQGFKQFFCGKDEDCTENSVPPPSSVTQTLQKSESKKTLSGEPESPHNVRLKKNYTSSVITPPQPQVESSIDKIGPNTQKLNQFLHEIESARETRVKLAGTKKTSIEEIDKAVNAEKMAKNAYESYRMELNEQIEDLRTLANQLRAYFSCIEITQLDSTKDSDQALVLDQYIDAKVDINKWLVGIEKARDLIDERWADTSLPITNSLISNWVELKQAMLSMSESCAKAMRTSKEAWQELSDIKTKLMDCQQPTLSKTLFNLSPDQATLILKWVYWEKNKYCLVPLFIRLLDTIEKENGIEDRPATVAQLSQWYTQLAYDDRDLPLASLCSFLPTTTLQKYLSVGDETVRRCIFLSSFLNYLPTDISSFFNFIWNYQGWVGRRDSLGNTLYLFLKELNHIYQTSDERHLVESIKKLTTQKPSSIPQEDCHEQEELVGKLQVCTANMRGFFKRLRDKSHEIYFRDLANYIQKDELTEAYNLCLSIKEASDSGILLGILSKDFQTHEKLEAKHEHSITKYVNSLVDETLCFIQSKKNFRRECELELANTFNADQYYKTLPDGDYPIGSTDWIGMMVKKAIIDFAEDNSSKSFHLNPDNLPGLVLFGVTEPNSKDQASAASAIQELFGKLTPFYTNSWLQAIDGTLSWKELLQDLVAKHFFEKQNSTSEKLQDFLSIGRPDAVIEGIAISDDFKKAAEQYDLLSDAIRLKDIKDSYSEASTSLEKKLDESEAKFSYYPTDAPARIEFEEIFNAFLDIPNVIKRDEYPKYTTKLRELCAQIDQLCRAPAEADEVQSMRDWLKAAGQTPSASWSATELHEAIEDTKKKKKEQRQHIIELKRISKERRAPKALSELCSTLADRLDFPTHWPPAETAEDCAFELSLFRDAAVEWWTLKEQLESNSTQYKKLSIILETIMTHLADEVWSRIQNKKESEAGGILKLFLEDDSHLSIRYYNLLVENGFVADTLESEPQTDSSASFDTIHLTDLRNKIRNTTKQHCSISYDNSVAEKMLVSFKRKHYNKALSFAMAEYLFQQEKAAVERLDEIAAILAISAWKLKDNNLIELREALALALRSRKFLHDFGDFTLLESLSLLNDAFSTKPIMHDDQVLSIANILKEIQESPNSSEQREIFNYAVIIAGPENIGESLWDIFTGRKDRGFQARVNVLLLLHSCGQDAALKSLFETLAGTKAKYLNAFHMLIKRAESDTSPQLANAIRQNLSHITSLGIPKPVKIYAETIVRNLDYSIAEINLVVSEELDSAQRPGHYLMTVIIEPKESDPPLTLRIELDECDFKLVGYENNTIQVCEDLMFSPWERTITVEVNNPDSAQIVSWKAVGETASGQSISKPFRSKVILSNQKAPHLSPGRLKEIYEGYMGKPVSGDLFVGRENELEQMERALDTDSPGAILLYGIRRLGKTSLLGEMKKRLCRTSQKNSHAYYLFVPVDTLEIQPDMKLSFEIFKHIVTAFIWEPKNDPIRSLVLDKSGFSKKELRKHLADSNPSDGRPFIYMLTEFVDELRSLLGSDCKNIVFVFDEFDKLVEAYRKEYESAVHEFINQLRKVATEDEHIGMVLSGSDLMRTLLDGYRSAFYGSAVTIELDCFNDDTQFDEAARIVAPHPVRGYRQFPDEVIREIVRITGGHPLYLRLLGLACAGYSQRRVVSMGMVRKAVSQLLQSNGKELGIPMPNVKDLSLQPKYALNHWGKRDTILAEVILLQLSNETTLERPYTSWKSVHDQLLPTIPQNEWATIRDKLLETNIIQILEKKRHWGLRFPIMAEALRQRFHAEIETLHRQLEEIDNDNSPT